MAAWIFRMGPISVDRRQFFCYNYLLFTNKFSQNAYMSRIGLRVAYH